MGKKKTTDEDEVDQTEETQDESAEETDTDEEGIKSITFKLKNGHTRTFHEGDHGEDWQSVAAEFATTHKLNIIKRTTA